jgi:WD40 repeat protein
MEVRMTSLSCRTLFLRRWIAAAVVVLSGAWVSTASAFDLATMSPADIRALQQRLTDAKCYSGPIDGVAIGAMMGALKACPRMDPALTIETGMHTAQIWRVSVDRDCKLMASGSEDRTVRLWSMPDGRLLRTLRVPIGSGDDAKIFGLAVSPDGQVVAAGGWDARFAQNGKMSIYLFDAASGELKARLGSFENVIQHLVFSNDGRFLAATLAGDQGLHVFDVARSVEIAVDRQYQAGSHAAAFAPDGRLFAAAEDGYLRAYDTSFRLVGRVRAMGGHEPYSVAVDPSGKHLAVGYYDARVVEVYRTSDLKREYAANVSGGTGGGLGLVSWSRDGSKLIAAGGYGDAVNESTSVIWDQPGPGRVPVHQRIASNTVASILPCGSGFAFGALDPVFGLLDSDGKVTFSKRGVAPDFRGMEQGFRVSNDGAQIRFTLEFLGKHPVVFDVSHATLEPADAQPYLTPPRVTGLNVTDWFHTPVPKLNRRPLPLDPNEVARSVAITSDRSRFVLGASFGLRAFDAQGPLLWRQPVPGEPWSTNLTGDGRLVVAAYGDGTVRWHRLSDGQELLALFVNRDDLRWVAWTPSGYYMASPGGEDMIGWTLNRGWDQAADFFPASRFRERFSRPDIVQQVLITLDEGEAIEAANKAANIRTDNSSVTSKLPPVIKIISPADGSTVRDRDITFEYEVRSPSGLAVDSVEILIDGRPTRGFKRVETKADGTKVEHEIVNIPGRNVQIGLIAHAGSLASTPSTVGLKWAGAAPTGDDLQKPKLYGVVVGVSAYRDSRLNLRYAAKDARDLAEALKLQKGGLYQDVELKVLTDADATTAEVKRALGWLEQSVTARDVGLVFLAGHGITDARQRYYYLDYDSDPSHPADSAVEDFTLKERTRSIVGKVLVFLDTCHAGQAMGGAGPTYINKLVEDLSSTDNGVVTFASSTGKQLSLEDDAWNNGAFTKALIEGLPAPGRKGRADITNKGVITTAALDFWLAERVRDLTHGSQSPVMQRPIPDFELFTAER